MVLKVEIHFCFLYEFFLENAKCPDPAPLLNGNVVFNDTDVGDIVEYTCKPGLTVRGQRKRYCLATLSWSGEAPTCSNQTESMINTLFVSKFILRYFVVYALKG